jgi:hypothetical protein
MDKEDYYGEQEEEKDDYYDEQIDEEDGEEHAALHDLEETDVSQDE